MLPMSVRSGRLNARPDDRLRRNPPCHGPQEKLVGYACAFALRATADESLTHPSAPYSAAIWRGAGGGLTRSAGAAHGALRLLDGLLFHRAVAADAIRQRQQFDRGLHCRGDNGRARGDVLLIAAISSRSILRSGV